jgi:hypothetical protein
MRLETHGRWPWVAAGLVVPMCASAAARRGELPEDGLWVAGLAFPILVSHQSEEWVWPGGFPGQRPARLALDRTRCLPRERHRRLGERGGRSRAVAADTRGRRGRPLVEAGNALMHTALALRERCYNPGVVTASMLMAPHAAANGRWLASSGRVSRRQGLLASARGNGFAALPLAMKMRMRRASTLSLHG